MTTQHAIGKLSAAMITWNTFEGIQYTYIDTRPSARAEGFMDGFHFFFRAGGCGWTFHIAPLGTDAEEVWSSAHFDGIEWGVYHNGNLYDNADRITESEIVRLIEGEYPKVCKTLSDNKSTGLLEMPAAAVAL